MSKKSKKKHTSKNRASHTGAPQQQSFIKQFYTEKIKPHAVHVKSILKKMLWFIQNIIPMLLFPIVTFYLFEWYTHNPWTSMKVPIQFLNIFLFELLMCLLLFLFGKLKTALMIETVFFMVVGLANYYVLDFRAAPIMPWDIFSLGTAATVADNFNYTLEKETIYVLLGFIALLIAEFFVPFRLKKNWKKGFKLRGAGLVISVLLLVGFTKMLHQDATISYFKMYDKLFTPTVMSKRDGTAVAFLMELKYLSIEKPSGYQKDDAKALLESYDSSVSQTEETPNIIVIMNEAFSDPAVLGEFGTNMDYMPFVHSILNGEVADTISGYLNVSVLGGNTANTEFEFLTGNTLAFLPQGSVAYQQYVKNELPSLASHLKSLGYDTVAMHPYNSSGWDRDTVYPLLGFDTSYFIKDWKNPEKIRKYVSDKACYDKIIDIYENKDSDTPLFVFNVTMQNHSSYSEEFDNFKPDITINNAKAKLLPNYLSLMKISDAAIAELVNYFSAQDEKTMIVFFGDHQPTNSVVSVVHKLNKIDVNNMTDEQEADRYKVPYFIWANYDINDATNVETSANYLGEKVLSAAELPLYDYMEFLKEFQEKYPVVTPIRAVDFNGNSTLIKEAKEDLNEYAILQYYQLFDSKKQWRLL